MRPNANTRPILEMHDRGLFDLPTRVLKAREQYEAVLGLAEPNFAPPKDYRGSNLAEQLVEAAEAGSRIDVGSVASEIARQLHAANIARRAASEAADTLADRLDCAIAGSADDILIDSVRPKHDRIVEELKSLLASDQEPSPKRDALVAQYSEVTRAAECLRRLSSQPKHSDGSHARIRNPEIFPRRAGAGGFITRRIPAGIVAQLAAGADVWLPLADEEDEAFLAASPRIAASVSLRAEQEQNHQQWASDNRARADSLRGADVVGPGIDKPDRFGIPIEYRD